MDKFEWVAELSRLRSWGRDLQFLLVAIGTLWAVTLLPIVNKTPLRIPVALFVALFLPGYALIAALFPEHSELSQECNDDESVSNGGINTLERIVLSFGTSVTVVPLVGLMLNFTPWGLRLIPILVGLTMVTLPFIGLAAIRRAQLPPQERFDPHPRVWLGARVRRIATPDDRTDAILNVLLVVSILLAAGSVTYAVSDSGTDEQFTEFYLLTENETGDLVATNYPTNFTTNEARSIVVGIGNEERQSETYTVVIQLQEIRIDDGSAVVTETEELDKFSEEVPAGRTMNFTREIVPQTVTGDRLRLQFLLYRGGVSTNSDPAAAYRKVHLWVTVIRGE
jgi:uncharacterized membrane protein